MQRTIAAAVAGLMLTAFNKATRYPMYAPRGNALPNNMLPPRKDKGTRYVFDARGTRRIAA